MISRKISWILLILVWLFGPSVVFARPIDMTQKEWAEEKRASHVSGKETKVKHASKVIPDEDIPEPVENAEVQDLSSMGFTRLVDYYPGPDGVSCYITGFDESFITSPGCLTSARTYFPAGPGQQQFCKGPLNIGDLVLVGWLNQSVGWVSENGWEVCN